MRFEGQRALVTGAASGIGLEIAKGLLAEGAEVIATDIDAAKLDQLRQSLGEGFQPVPCDAGDVAAIKALFERLDRLDILVNNAGIGLLSNPELMEEADYDAQMAVLLKGPSFHVKYAAPLLRESANGNVVNISSASALISLNGYTAYGQAKAALIKMTKDMVVTVPGVRHNVVLPGLIDTPILRDAYGEDAIAALDQIIALSPVPRFGQPRDIAKASLFLASEDASFINGTELVVDGGLSRVHLMSVPAQ